MIVPPTLRRASPADFEEIVEVFLSCWRGSYSGVLPSHVLQGMTEERARGLWERALSTQDGEEQVTVATNAVTGTVRGVVRHGLKYPGHGIIWSLYVDPASQGCGVGSRLLRGAETSLTEAGAESASLWVFADNAASIAFYAHHGWLPGSEAPARSREFGERMYRLSKSFPDGRPGDTPTIKARSDGCRADQAEAATATAAGACP